MYLAQPDLKVKLVIGVCNGFIKGFTKAMQVFGVQAYFQLFQTRDAVGRAGAQQLVEMRRNKKCLRLGLPRPDAVLGGRHRRLENRLLKGKLVGQLVGLDIESFVGKGKGLCAFSIGIFKPMVKD